MQQLSNHLTEFTAPICLDQNATHISQISNVSGDRAEFLDDPDIICGRGLHIINEEAGSERYQNMSNGHRNTNSVTGSGNDSHMMMSSNKASSVQQPNRRSHVTREVKSAGGDANMQGKVHFLFG